MRTMKQTLLLTLLAMSAICSASENWTNFSNFTQVTSIAQKGNEIWVAAHGGVMKYDNSTGIKTFFRKKPGDLPSFTVEVVRLNAISNNIWIGTYDNGLAIFNGTNWTPIPFPDKSALLYQMRIANDGSVWCATSVGLYHYINSSFALYLPAGNGNLSSNWDIDLIPGGRIFIGSNTPFIFDPSNNQIQNVHATGFAYASSKVYVIDSTHYVFASDHGEVDFITDTMQTDSFELGFRAVDVQLHNGKVALLPQDGTALFERNANSWDSISLANFPVNAFFSASNGEIWAGSYINNGSLIHRDAQAALTTTTMQRSNISGNFTQKLVRDDDGNMLIVNENGVQKFDVTQNNFENITDSALPTTFITNIFQHNNKYYLGTAYEYFYEYTTGTGWQKLGEGILPSTEVDNFAMDAQNNLWLSGPGYVAKYNGSSFQVFDYNTDTAIKPNVYTRSMHWDNTRNVLWVATYSGILKYYNGSFTIINGINTPSIHYYDAVEAITEDDDHNIWFGTVYGGVVKYDGNTYALLLLPYTAGNQFISGLEFIDNAMYVSDNLNGLWKYENGTWDSLNACNSALSDNFVRTMSKDGAGNLWLGIYQYGADVYNKNGLTISGIKRNDRNIDLVLYPNPSNGQFIFKTTADKMIEVKIFAIDGKLVKQYNNLTNGQILDLSTQTAGIYFAEVKGESGVQTIKLIKN